MALCSVPDAVDRIRRGEIVIVVDDEDRENEGDLTMAAEHVTAEAVNFMIRHAGGLLCLPCSGDRLDELHLPAMVPGNDGTHHTAFTVSIDHRTNGTGISAADRAATIRGVADPSARPWDFRRPGHVFPLRARPGGVLERPGHTEAAVDLVRLAGLVPCAAICEVLNPDGSVARLADLEPFAARHGLAIVTIDDLIAYRTELASPARSAAAE